MSVHPLNMSLPVFEPAQTKGADRGKGAPPEGVAAGAAEAAVSKKAESEQAVNPEAVARDLNKLSERAGSDISFSVDHDLNRVIVTVSREGTGEVVLQIPSEEMIALTRRLREMEQNGDTKGAILGLRG